MKIPDKILNLLDFRTAATARLKCRFNEMADSAKESYLANGVGPEDARDNSKLYDEIASDIMCFVDEPANSRSVLEIGCGTGEIIMRLSPNVAEVIGVDVAEKMVELCKHKGLTAEVVGGELPYAENRFDFVIIYSVVINFENSELLDNLISEAFRVTTSGGRVFVGSIPNSNELDFLTHKKNSWFRIIKRATKKLLGIEDINMSMNYYAYNPEKFIRYCHNLGASEFIMKRSLLAESGLNKFDVIYRVN